MLVQLHQIFELSVDHLEPTRDLFFPIGPAFLPFAKLFFRGPLGRTGLIKILMQSQEGFSQP